MALTTFTSFFLLVFAGSTNAKDGTVKPSWAEKTDQIWTDRQSKLSDVINEIMSSEYFRVIAKGYKLRGDETFSRNHSISADTFGVLRTPSLSEYIDNYIGGIMEPCTSVKVNISRVGCCEHEGMRYIFNTKMNDKSFTIYGGDPPKVDLPSMESMVLQQRHKFAMALQHKPGLVITESKDCQTFFRGTLHIKGITTANNVYHSIADNFMVILATILTDAILFPEYLHLPRMMAKGHEPQHSETSHFKITENLFSAGVHNLKDLQGMCFSRVIWGNGPHVFYSDTRMALRRLSGDFMRAFVKKFYSIKPPAALFLNAQIAEESTPTSTSSSSSSPSSSTVNAQKGGVSEEETKKENANGEKNQRNPEMTDKNTSSTQTPKRERATNDSDMKTLNTSSISVTSISNSSSQSSESHKHRRALMNTQYSEMDEGVLENHSGFVSRRLQQQQQQRQGQVQSGDSRTKAARPGGATGPASNVHHIKSLPANTLSLARGQQQSTSANVNSQSKPETKPEIKTQRPALVQQIKKAVENKAQQATSQNKAGNSRTSNGVQSPPVTPDKDSNSNSKAEGGQQDQKEAQQQQKHEKQERDIIKRPSTAADNTKYTKAKHPPGTADGKGKAAAVATATAAGTTTTTGNNAYTTVSSSTTTTISSSSSSSSSSSDGFMKIDGRPVRVVLFTRGDSGNGRSLRGEEKILDRLRQAGAIAVKCCDFSKTSVDEQISYAYYADVVMGMHGAALVHAVFSRRGVLTLELKTLYGYASSLFALVADSRFGMHAQVDIRDYWKPGGHKDVDDSMVDRVMALLQRAVPMMDTLSKELRLGGSSTSNLNSNSNSNKMSASVNARNTSTGSDIVQVGQKDILNLPSLSGAVVHVLEKISNSTKGDYIVGPSAQSRAGLLDILGPTTVEKEADCNSLILKKLRDELGSKEQKDHCQTCAVSKRC